jgi:hypothetical protein
VDTIAANAFILASFERVGWRDIGPDNESLYQGARFFVFTVTVNFVDDNDNGRAVNFRRTFVCDKTQKFVTHFASLRLIE